MPDAETGRSDGAREALMAGTLCLMSCFADRPRSAFGRKIAENLRVLACHTGYSAELRTILERLADRWDHIALERQAPLPTSPRH